ncbi:L-fuconate dehydratase [Planctomonas sp. JC2975]|uniref:L-fuconate dehydratase n=1 Tax=Planctomonas sp. JC2975 TaxID=2729626 RepID=UPI0014764A17|nr:L-fuconate dehydratase [Planctomonas sp. JC2975]NNC12930.1 L-fuconate dehydratase [Planctomonas sp. JC2975]
MSTIVAVDTRDVRFPTSLSLDGSDAMNPDPDYSAAYVSIRTDAADGLTGDAFVFTIGRGNDVQVAGLNTLRGHLIGLDVEELLADMGAASRLFMHDSQLRWLGPEKGVMHMAIGAVVNALWDLRAKRAGEPLWLHLSRLSSEELVSLIDFRYLTDALTPEEALDILRAAEPTREERIAELLEVGYPAYTTTPGWLGYSDEKLARLCREAVEAGFGQVKLKVGADLADDIRRFRIARQVLGDGYPIAMDANQRWGVQEAIDWVSALAEFDPAWIEEPTSPDDILGHAAIARGVAPVRVATGEHVQNRIVFKQMLQADALQVMQIDAARVGGVNENIANLLLAAKFGVPVCPHAGGVGLCEAVQHLSMFDFVAVTGTMDGRMIEYVDHLHEHFVTPTVVENGRYVTPTAPGAGTEMLPASLDEFEWHAPETDVRA